MYPPDLELRLMRQRLHTLEARDWQRPLSLNAAWVVFMACLLPLALVAGWLLHAWVK